MAAQNQWNRDSKKIQCGNSEKSEKLNIIIDDIEATIGGKRKANANYDVKLLDFVKWFKIYLPYIISSEMLSDPDK